MQEVKLRSLDQYDIVLGELVGRDYVFGNYEDNGVWKVYEVGERASLNIVGEYPYESDALDGLLSRLEARKRLDDWARPIN
jgi:hypothetical protein